MKRIIILVVGGFFLISAVPVWGMDKALLGILQRIMEEKIIVWAKDQIIVNAVKEANKQATKSQEEINKLDNKWQTTEEVDDWIKWFLNNDCAIYLKKLQNKIKGERTLYSEIFVMDKQGSIVAESDKTSDYWQGDEDKFIKSFAEEKGSNFIDEPSFDKSTKAYSVQISVPVFDPATKNAIGAMTVGIDLDALTDYMLGL